MHVYDPFSQIWSHIQIINIQIILKVFSILNAMNTVKFLNTLANNTEYRMFNKTYTLWKNMCYVVIATM